MDIAKFLRTHILRISVSGCFRINITGFEILSGGRACNVFYYDFDEPLLQFRSSHQRYSVKKGVLRNFKKFTCKTPVPESPFS